MGIVFMDYLLLIGSQGLEIPLERVYAGVFCGRIVCKSLKNINALCACVGFAIGVGGNLQVCDEIPVSDVYDSGWTMSFPLPFKWTKKMSIVLGSNCLGVEVGKGYPFSNVNCSCAVRVVE